MKKKRMKVAAISVTVFIIVVILPVCLLYTLNNGNPITKFIANKKVPAYLLENGYEEDELYESHFIEPKHTINKKFFHGHYKVVFEDETEITYYYGVTKIRNKVKQFCEKDKLHPDGITVTVKGETKHSEKECSPLH